MANTTAITLGQTVAVDPASATPLAAYRRKRREVTRGIGSRPLLMQPLGKTQQADETQGDPPGSATSPVPFQQSEHVPVWKPLGLLMMQMEILQQQFQRLGRVVDGLPEQRSATTLVAQPVPLTQSPSGSVAGTTPTAEQPRANQGLLRNLRPLTDVGTSLTIVGGAVIAAAGPTVTPVPMPSRRPPRGRWASARDAGQEAFRTARVDAALEATHTALTASTPEEKGEGYGGAAGGLLGEVIGAGLGKVFLKRFGGEETGALIGSFAGEKLGAWAGKSAMTPHPETAPTPAQPSTVKEPASGVVDAIGSAAQTVMVVGAAAAGIQYGRRVPELARSAWRTARRRSGRAGSTDEQQIPDAGAGPSSTRSPSPSRLPSEVWSTTRKLVRLSAIEAGLKAVSTYTTASTAEEKGAGYGGAAGGLIGSVALGALGTFLLPGIGTAIGASVGGFIGDKVGSAVGVTIGRYFSTPSAAPAPVVRHSAATSRQPRRQRDANAAAPSPTTPMITAPLMVPVAKQFSSRINQQAGTQIGRELLGSGIQGARSQKTRVPLRLPSVDGQPSSLIALPVAPASISVPPAPLALPETPATVSVTPAPVQRPHPVTQQVNLTATIPITVQGAIAAPHQLALELETAVRRVMADLQARAGHAQMADAPQPF